MNCDSLGLKTFPNSAQVDTSAQIGISGPNSAPSLLRSSTNNQWSKPGLEEANPSLIVSSLATMRIYEVTMRLTKYTP